MMIPEPIRDQARTLSLDLGVRSFLFLRHGETEANRRCIFQPPDEPLNRFGLLQAEQAAPLITRAAPGAVVASTMARALQTAAIVVPVGLSVMPAPTLRERDFGALIGRPYQKIEWGDDPPGGESLAAFMARVHDGVADILNAGQRKGETLLVSHGGVLLVIAALLGIDMDPKDMGNGLALRFDRTANGWALAPVT